MLRNRLSAAAHVSRGRALPATLLAVGALGLVAGCGSSSATSVSTPASVPTSSAPTTSAPSAASTSAPSAAPTTVAPSASAVVGPADCESAHLALRAGQAQGAAGSTIATFILRNAGTSACSLYGYPGVSLVNVAGTQLGAAAVRHGAAVARFTVQPGQVASFELQIPIAGCPTSSPQSTSIRVYPPNEKSALEIAGAYPVCAALSVTAVRSGDGQ